MRTQKGKKRIAYRICFPGSREKEEKEPLPRHLWKALKEEFSNQKKRGEVNGALAKPLIRRGKKYS